MSFCWIGIQYAMPSGKKYTPPQCFFCKFAGWITSTYCLYQITTQPAKSLKSNSVFVELAFKMQCYIWAELHSSTLTFSVGFAGWLILLFSPHMLRGSGSSQEKLVTSPGKRYQSTEPRVAVVSPAGPKEKEISFFDKLILFYFKTPAVKFYLNQVQRAWMFIIMFNIAVLQLWKSRITFTG